MLLDQIVYVVTDDLALAVADYQKGWLLGLLDLHTGGYLVVYLF